MKLFKKLAFYVKKLRLKSMHSSTLYLLLEFLIIILTYKIM